MRIRATIRSYRLFFVYRDTLFYIPNNWIFRFMGANQDSVFSGEKFGMRQNSCISYSATPEGLADVMQNVSTDITQHRLNTI